MKEGLLAAIVFELAVIAYMVAHLLDRLHVK